MLQKFSQKLRLGLFCLLCILRNAQTKLWFYLHVHLLLLSLFKYSMTLHSVFFWWSESPASVFRQPERPQRNTPRQARERPAPAAPRCYMRAQGSGSGSLQEANRFPRINWLLPIITYNPRENCTIFSVSGAEKQRQVAAPAPKRATL